MAFTQEDLDNSIPIDWFVYLVGIVMGGFVMAMIPTWVGQTTLRVKVPFIGEIQAPLNPLQDTNLGDASNNHLVDVSGGSDGRSNSVGLSMDFDINNGVVDDEVTAIFHACLALGVIDPWQISYILATAQWEAGGFSTLRERGDFNYFAYQAGGNGYTGRMGNRSPQEAANFRGRGFVQVTGRDNVTRMSELYGVDFLSHPEKLEEPQYALTILVEGMIGGLFTGKALPQYVDYSVGKKDYVGARRVVNGNDKAKLIARYAEEYEDRVTTWLRDYGYTEEDFKK